MSTYFEELREDLRLATERHHRSPARSRRGFGGAGSWGARRGDARRGLRRWPLRPSAVVALAAAVGAASATAASLDLLGGAHPLAGRVPAAALTAPQAVPSAVGAQGATALPTGLRYAVPITPDLEPGTAGWCGSPVYTAPGAHGSLAGASACATATAGGLAVVAGGEPLGNLHPETRPTGPGNRAAHERAQLEHLLQDRLHGRQNAFQLDWFVYSSPVAAVKIGAATYRTLSSPDLPAGWRALVLFTRGSLPPAATPVDGRGRPLVEPPAQHGEATQRLLGSIAIRHVPPSRLPVAPCALGPARLSAGGSEWEVLAAQVPALGSQVQPNTLLSCARAWYATPDRHAVYSAALLLDGQSPMLPAPTLPGLTATSTPGIYEEDAATGGSLSARRVHNAWLVVEGPSAKLRHRLLQEIPVRGSYLKR